MSTPAESTSFEDLYLSEFKKNNPFCKFTIDNGKIVIGSLWNDTNIQVVFSIEDIESIKKLNNIKLNPQFDAIIHIDTNSIEYLLGYLDTTDDLEKSFMDRKFDLNLEGCPYTCEYALPSDVLLLISRNYRRIDSSSQILNQLLVFKDGQKIDKLSKVNQEYFENKVPRCFFVKPDKPITEIDVEKMSRHINFLMKYYDRSTPQINIRLDTQQELVKIVKPRRYIEECFPTSFALNTVDDFVLQLLGTASESNPRFAFIYYYQVFEYAGFYFLDSKVKKELNQFMRDPSIVSCSDEKLMQLFVFLSELNHSDEVKMRKVIEELCDPKTIWKEIENDKDFFANSVEFDGGFNLSALIAKDTTVESWNTMWMPKLYDHLTKIRNCLVHARERRQCNVILPSNNNSRKIRRYLPLISRLAEQIALGI